MPKHILEFVGRRVTICTADDEVIEGRLLAYDRCQNLVLSDCEQTRELKNGKIHRTALGLLMIRGCALRYVTYHRSLPTERNISDSRVQAATRKESFDVPKVHRNPMDGLRGK